MSVTLNRQNLMIRADEARDDAEPEWSKKLAAKCDEAMTKCDEAMNLFRDDAKRRSDAEEASKKEAEEKEKAEKIAADKKKADEEAAKKERADKAKADAEAAEKEAKEKADAEEAEKKAMEEKEKADAARADAASADSATEIAALKAQVAALTGAVHISDEDRVALANIQARADNVAMLFDGKRAPQPLPGETPRNYKIRMAAPYKGHSKQWKEVDLAKLDDAVLNVVAEQIYADAEVASNSPVDIAAGTLREIITTDRVGRKVSTFKGSKSAWMDQFKAPAQLQVAIRKDFH